MSLQSIIESLLFVSGEPVKIKKIIKVTGASRPEAENALMLIEASFTNEDRGLCLLRKGDEVQMVTASENAKYVDSFVKNDLREDLSQAALETLAVVAYKGPVNRMQVENIRGVNCSFILRNLLIRGLIERVDNPQDNRSYLYQISFNFLKKMGIERIEDLPKYKDFSDK